MAFNISYKFEAIDAFSGVANKIKSSVSGINEKFRQLATVSKNASASISRVGDSIKSVGTRMTLFATTSIGLLGFSMIKAASDAEETASKFNTVFSSIAKDSDNAAKNLSRDFGLSRTAAKQLLGDTGDLLTGFGFSQDAALKLSTQVNELAVDLASFTNFSGGAEGASAALTKALLGERESLKSLGIAISEEQVKNKVATMVKAGASFASLKQAKAAATLQLALEQSKNAIGDFARTSQSTANQTRSFSARLNDLRETIGKKLEPTFNRILSRINTIIPAFEDFVKNNPRIVEMGIAFAGILAVLGPVLIAIGLIATGIGIMLSPVVLIAAGIAGIAAAVVLAWNKFEGLRRSVDAIGSILFSLFKILLAPMRAFLGLLGDVLGFLLPIRNVTGSVASSFESLTLDGFISSLETAAAFLENLAQKVENFFSLEPLENVIDGGVNAVKNKLAGLTGGALDFIGLGPDKKVSETAFASLDQPGVSAQEVIARSQLDANIQLNAPPGVVGNTNTRVSGASTANVGLSVAEAGT